MFKKVYWKICDCFINLFSKPENNQKFIDQCKTMKEVLKIIEDNKDKTGYRLITEKDYYMICANIRFASLQSGHKLGRLTSDEERELESMLTINLSLDFSSWARERERVGMRSCYFPN